MESQTRRRFIQGLGGSAAATVLSGLAPSGHAQGEKPLLRRNHPNAVALGYQEDHQRVDTGAWPKKAPGQQCSSCALFRASDDGTGQCSIFPRHRVAASGWCNAWLGD